MDPEREVGAVGPEALREWLLQLERRVGELERADVRRERARRRSRLVLLVGVALYILVFYWELTKLV